MIQVKFCKVSIPLTMLLFSSSVVQMGRARLFLDTFIDMFRHKNIEATLQLYIASFSRARNDLAQWRAYADNGQGFAIGFSPHMFSLVENLPTDRPPEFVGAVRYTLEDVFTRYQPPILEAAAIFLDTVVGNDDLVRDRTIGKSFMEELARELIASPIIGEALQLSTRRMNMSARCGL
jgi:hypothetical protein